MATVLAGGTTTVDLDLTPTVPVTGHVSTPDGAPVTGATVFVRTPGCREPRLATTDADGWFASESPVARARSRCAVRRPSTTAAARSESPIQLRARHPATAPGSWTFRRWARTCLVVPAPGAVRASAPGARSVVLATIGDGPRIFAEAAIDADGTFVARDLPPGMWGVTPGGDDDRTARDRVELAPGGDARVALSLRPENERISGRLAGLRGEPIPSPEDGSRDAATTDASGTFRLRVIPGDYAVQLDAEDAGTLAARLGLFGVKARATVRVAPGREAVVELRLMPAD